MAILAVFPLPLRGISDRGYRFSLAGSAVACAHCLYLNNRVQTMLSSRWSLWLLMMNLKDRLFTRLPDTSVQMRVIRIWICNDAFDLHWF